ncbi:MAG TPA: HAMP domain-containing sensor histidine kinase [Polyangiaceae bacterium]|nr:HAMP domain-containing sensor histidine kinase [Polyangiaceae bacterium]
MKASLLLRVYLHGILMLALATGASFVVGTYVLKPALEVPARPSTTWIAWHLAALVDQPEQLRAELEDVRRVRVEVSLFEPSGKLIATNAKRVPPPLSARELRALPQEPTRFAGGTGVVATFDHGTLLRYARVSYPAPELPLRIALGQLAVALLVIAALSMPLARSISAPVERLAALARALGAGNLAARARSRRRDEIGDLARAFDEMAERLVQLRRSEKELLANVSHELRTPLARIRLALELVRDGDTRRADSYLTDIEEDLAELEQLLDDVMTATRLELARGGDALPPLRRQRVAALDVLEAAKLRFARRFPERRLESRFQANLPHLDADPTLLRRVLDNLLDNAVKFSDAAAPIELEAERDATGAELVLRVRDQGVGIPAADLERVFEPFFRSDPSRTRSTGGVGLGLTVVRRILHAHGGSIRVESTPQQGTRFEIRVPEAPPPAD